MAKRKASNQGVLPGAPRIPFTTLVKDYIKNYIVTNGLQPGDLLPSEVELAEALQVSRVSVREAVKALQALGVIEVRHGKGLYVRSFNLDAALDVLSYSLDFGVSTVYELYQIRKWLEIAVIGDVVKGVAPTDLEQLDQLLAEWEASIPSGAWPPYDRKFHRALNSVVHNQMLLLVLDAFWTVFDNATDETIKAQPDPWATLEDHRRIVEAVRQGNPDAARQALVYSYINFENRYRAVAQAGEHAEFVLQYQT